MGNVIPISFVAGLIVVGLFMSADASPIVTGIAGLGTLAVTWYLLEKHYREKEKESREKGERK